MSLPARLCCSTSENSVKAKFAEFTSLLKNSSTPLPSTLQGLKNTAIAVFWP